MGRPDIDLARAEKVSSIVRNCLVGLVALTGFLASIASHFDDPLLVTVSETYLSRVPMDVAFTSALPTGKVQTHGMRVGTVTDAFVENRGNGSVNLDIRIPSISDLHDDGSQSPDESLRTVVHLKPGCSLTPEEVRLTDGGFLRAGVVGTITVPKFPPKCSLTIELLSTELSQFERVMNGNLEVFYDGKAAKVIKVARLYGPMSRYFAWVDRHGWTGILIGIVCPILLFTIVCLTLQRMIVRRFAARSTYALFSP